MAEYEIKKSVSDKTITNGERQNRNSLHIDNSMSSCYSSQLKQVIQRNRHQLNSGELANNLGPAPFPNAEAHHIIPIETVNQAFPQRLRRDDNDYYDYDTAWNGIYLKSTQPFRNSTGLPYHRKNGRFNHNDYTNYVESFTNDVNLQNSDEAEDIVTDLENRIGRMDGRHCLDDIENDSYDEDEDEDDYDEDDYDEDDYDSEWNEW